MSSEQVGKTVRELSPKSVLSFGNGNWWLFCLAIVALKFLLLALDPLPKLYLGDSLSYLWTAISGWIPPDRSYFYGYVIRWLSGWTQSLTSLLIVQVFLGAVIAITLAWVCRVMFGLSEALSYFFGFLCAIDPLQLAWERYVMTETFSLFFYALVLQQSFVYLRDRRITTLVVIQCLSIITIGFRMIFLVIVEVMAFALPLIAFLSEIKSGETATAVRSGRLRFLNRASFWGHLATSVVAMFLLDQGYKQANGFLSHREPDHLYGTGYFLLAAWAPTLQPQDAADSRLAEIIQHGSEFGLRNPSLRLAQRFTPGCLIDRWRHTETDERKSSQIARRTALNAFLRNPAAVIGLAAKTYFASWSREMMENSAKSDVAFGIPEDQRQLAALGIPKDQGQLAEQQLRSQNAERFHLVLTSADLASNPQTLTKWYYIAGWPYYFVVLLSPLLSFVLLFVAANKACPLLLFVHSAVMFAVTFLLTTYPAPRFLHSLSFLTILILALTVKSLLDRWKNAHREDVVVC